jgi:chromosome segregation ATPase
MKKLETFETEMLELRLYNTKKSIENELEKDDIDGLSSPNNHLLLSPTTNSPSNCNDELISYGFKLKASSHELDKLRRENDNLKRKLQDKKDETEKLNVNERNMFDLRLKERDTEFFEIEKQNTILKRKYQKLSEEMQDIQRMLEDNQIRNRELEKIQSRFDIDIHTLQSKLRDEIENREKCERERDQAVYEISSLKRDIDSQKQEITNQVEKTERLERDLKGTTDYFFLI